jgi:hypothetical protein
MISRISTPNTGRLPLGLIEVSRDRSKTPGRAKSGKEVVEANDPALCVNEKNHVTLPPGPTSRETERGKRNSGGVKSDELCDCIIIAVAEAGSYLPKVFVSRSVGYRLVHLTIDPLEESKGDRSRDNRFREDLLVVESHATGSCPKSLGGCVNDPYPKSGEGGEGEEKVAKAFTHERSPYP